MSSEVRKVGASDIHFGTSTSTSVGGKVYHQFSASDLPLDAASGSSVDAAMLNLQVMVPSSEHINFPTPALPHTTVGDTYWDDTWKTLSTVTTANTTLQHGQEVIVYADNKTASNINNGRVVYVSGGTGKRANVTLADNDAEASSAVIGMATQDIAANSGVGFVTLIGTVNGINTTGADSESGGETWAEGDLLYLSGTSGKMTNVKPSAPKYAVVVGTVTDRHASTGSILVHPQPVWGRVPNGGTTSQVLSKASNSDRDVEWASVSSGATAFTGLTDAPSSYTGQASKLVAVKSDVSGLEFVAQTGAIECVIDGGGSAIATGIAGDIVVPFACTITSATILADQTGSIVVDVWKDSYANYPPTVADTITASAKPTLSSAVKATDSTLTGWTKTVAAGDIIRFNVDSASTVTRATLVLNYTRT